MTHDPKQAKTMLGWLPQQGLPSAAPGQPAPVAPGQPPQGAPGQPAPVAPAYAKTQYAGPQPATPAAGAPHGYGQPQHPGYGAQPQPGHGAQQPGYGAQPGAYGAQPQPGAYGAQPQPGYGAQPQPGYGTQPQPGYGAQPGAYGAQPQPGAYGAQPQPGAYGAQPQPGYGAQPGAGSWGAGAAQAQNAGGFGGFGALGGAAAAAASHLPQGLSSEPRATDGSSGSLRDQVNATEGVSDRVRFIRLTYLHLLGAILAFAGLEYLLFTNSFLIEKVSGPFVTYAIGGRWNWGVVLAVFMVVSWVADYWASHATSRPLQYAGLVFYVIAEAIIFVPLLAIVQWKTAAIIAKGGGDPNIIRDAAYTTLGIFGALTASVFITKKDFSFMRTGLMMAGAAATMLVFLSLIFGFNLGIVFSIAMVLLAAGYILYQTSQILAHYDPRNYVAAALALFSSVALMFWYVIRIFMRMRE